MTARSMYQLIVLSCVMYVLSITSYHRCCQRQYLPLDQLMNRLVDALH